MICYLSILPCKGVSKKCMTKMTIGRNLNLFEENRTEEGKSKSKKLASEVLGKATVKTETKELAKDASGSSAVKTEDVKKESKNTEENTESEDKVKTEDKNEGRFNMDKFKKLEEKANTEDRDEDEKMETEEIEDFKEYSSDEDEEDEDVKTEDMAAEISENEDGGYDIEFVMPKFISEKPKSKNEGKLKESLEGKSKQKEEEVNDFFINEGEQYNQSDEENEAGEDSSSDGEEGGGKPFDIFVICIYYY